MKILHFIPRLSKGGAERVVIDLANEASRRGHDVSILTRTEAPAELGTSALRDEISIRCLGRYGESRGLAYAGIVPWVIANRAWLLSQDVIHCHLSMGSVFGAAVQALRFLTRRRGPVVVETYHAVGTPIPRLDRTIHSLLLSRRDAVAFIADDPYWRRFREGRPRPLFRTIANGVSVPPAVDRASSDRYRRETAGIPDGAVVLASVGRLVFERRPDLLVETFARLTTLTSRNVHLVLAGDGPMRAQLIANARSHGLEDRIHLPGLILNPVDVFGITDLYLSVNVGPITGIAALEAAFTGVPIAAIQFDLSYQRTGTEWIWASSDPDELAAYIAALLDQPAKLEKLARDQRDYVQANHSLESMADAYDSFYREALGRRGG